MNILEDSYFRIPPTASGIKSGLCRISHAAGIAKPLRIGKSVLGRDIYALRIGCTEKNNSVLYIGGVHGSEWLTTLLLMKFACELCSNLDSSEQTMGADMRRLLSERGAVIVPMLNPDGIEIAHSGSQSAFGLSAHVERLKNEYSGIWQANARGIDINHNFDAGFYEEKKLERAQGICSPRPGKFGGIRPHSEPETRAAVNLCEAFRFIRAIAFHSQGEVIYHGYGKYTPPNSELICRLLCAQCGYSPDTPSGTASHAGFKDWFVKTYRRPGFTVEIGRGKNPLPIEDLNPIYARLYEMLLTGLML